MIKQVFVTAAFSVAASLISFSQSVVDLIGKPMTDPVVGKFSTDYNLDPANGLSYAKGVQLFQEEGRVESIYLFNNSIVNGQEMTAFPGQLPFDVSFNDNLDILKKKISGVSTAVGEQISWDMGNYQLQVSFTDEKKTSISYISLQKK